MEAILWVMGLCGLWFSFVVEPFEESILWGTGYFPSVMAWSLARGGGEQFREDKHSRMSVLRAQVAGGQEKEQERKECGARLLGKELN